MKRFHEVISAALGQASALHTEQGGDPVGVQPTDGSKRRARVRKWALRRYTLRQCYTIFYGPTVYPWIVSGDAGTPPYLSSTR